MVPLRDANPTHKAPVITVALIAVNLLVWALELGQDAVGTLEPFLMEYALVPARFTADPLGELPTLFTAMFLHGSWGHLLGNMLYLWIFGDNVEDRLGRARFVVFYFVTGLAASLAQVAIEPGGTIPNVGASGAIAGVMGGYLVMFPRARVVALVGYFVTRVPAVLVLVLWFVFQLFGGVGSLGMHTQGGGVAFFAHIGGFVAGLMLVGPFGGRRRRRGSERLGDGLPPP